VVLCGTGQFHVVLHQNAVIKDGDVGFPRHISFRIEARTVKNDVVGLPNPRRPGSIHQGRMLAINGGGFAIGIGHVIVGIENLNS